MESVFEAFISNPALYSAGHLVGETLHFPTNTEEVQSLLKRIGVDGVRCQEYFHHGKLIRQMWKLGIRDKKLLCIIKQMKEAGALAEASRGDPVHKKKGPDRGDR